MGAMDRMHRLGRLFQTHPAAVTLVLAALLTAASYGGSLRNGFVWDDETLVVNNPYVHNLSRWPRYFLDPDSISSDQFIAKTYRPLQTLSLALDQALWRDWSGGFHLTSLLIHLAACLAVFFFFTDVVGPGASSVAAILFAVHPALSEGVLCLASRGGQLSALLGLLASGLLLRVRRPFDARHMIAVPTAALAFFSKEPAIALVALFPLLHAVLGRPWPFRSRRTWLLHAPFAAAALLYLALRHRIVGSMEVADYWGGSLMATLQLQAKVFAIYLRLLLWPLHLQGRYSVAPLGPFPDAAATAAVLLSLALILLSIVGLRKTGAPRLLSLAALWFYVSLLPVSNLIPIPGSMLGERFIYFSFAGMFPLLVGAAATLPGRSTRRALFAAGTIAAMAFVATDVARTAVWRDNAAYFKVLASQEPDDPIVQIGMAGEEIKMGMPESAVRRLERFLGAKGTAAYRGKLRYWYGVALLRAGRSVEAYRQLRIVEGLTGVTTELALSLAEAAAASGDLKAARSILERAAKTDAANDAVWNGLGNVAWLSGDPRGAATHYRRALQINAFNREAAITLEKVERALSPSSR